MPGTIGHYTGPNAMIAEIERLTAERDEWKDNCELRSQTAIDRLESVKKLTVENERLQAALKPFADYADKRHIVPGSMVITNGSALAKGQLTMAHCYHAAAALEQSAAAEGK